jgi:cytochrome c-type biogenesis protein CcmH/NrfG
LLLDRRKIRKWAKWVALILAVIFALSFLFMGVGYGGAGFNISQIFTGGCSNSNQSSTATTSVEQQLTAYDQALQTNPNDKNALLGVANLFAKLYQEGQGNGNQYLVASAKYLEKLVEVDPTQKDLYIRLANIYLNKDVLDYTSAVAILNKAVSVDPQNADVYLKLGIAQKGLNNKSAAVLAWQKYLELAPNGDAAVTVTAEIKKLTETTTTTAPASTTTTAGSGAPTTAGATTTTAAPTTTTTAAK